MVWSAQSRPFPLSILMSGKCKKVEKARLYARASRQWWPPRVVRASICAAGSTSAFRLLRCRAADVGKGGRASQLSEAEDRESVAAAAAAAAAVEQRQWRRPVGGAVVDLALLWTGLMRRHGSMDAQVAVQLAGSGGAAGAAARGAAAVPHPTSQLLR